jgi:hypothetical protein
MDRRWRLIVACGKLRALALERPFGRQLMTRKLFFG